MKAVLELRSSFDSKPVSSQILGVTSLRNFRQLCFLSINTSQGSGTILKDRSEYQRLLAATS